MHRKLLLFFVIILFIISGEAISQTSHPSGTYDVIIPKNYGVRTDILENIAPVIEKSIRAGYYPGAVVLVGHRGHMIYRGVFGYQSFLPDKTLMQFDTLFDLASLTKVIATTPAIMQLLEQGKLTLDTPVATYWPTFGSHGKNKITVRELLTHESGLPADIELIHHSKELIYKQIEQLHASSTKKFVYSDINFILAHLVEILSGESFDQYAQRHIFNPLKMTNTFFNPTINLRDRIAPTELSEGQLRWGKVQDPLSFAMGGVSGNAGLFSDANDLSLYAECLLNGGRITSSKKEPTEDHYLLGPLSILKMTTPQTPPQDVNVRGLGWDIDSPYSNRGVLLPVTSFGHTGWTGTSIWVDPTTQTYIIILTSRLHPKPTPHNQLIEDRRLIATFVAASLTDISSYSESNTGLGELARAYSTNHV
jgi:CubicO group peptidase (beta-lactamase class C family)